ncbi:MAG: hypothetical protein EBZ05_05930 [Verrucomicrobia bacterium]|nr:hypothetical protein [Verrucomicrobiota bacterium]
MSKLKSILYSYTYNPSIENKLELAEEYFNQQQYAAALSYYLNTAEISEDKDLQYYCLLQCAKSIEIPGNRKISVITLYKHAINLLPTRPEAYFFLSQYYELNKDWFDSYTFANLGLQYKPINDKYSKLLKYTEEYVLIFQKAIAAWHIGRAQESRDLLQILIHNYDLKEPYRSLVIKNATTLGIGPVGVCNVPYVKNENKLKFNFKNWDIIDRNYSQVLQDMFVLTMLDGKYNGTYLEIGSGDPYHFNNTYLLESKFNWTGKGIEIQKELCNRHSSRKNSVICEDALEINYSALLSTITSNNTIDYLQLDCEPAEITYKIMTKIPFEKYKFAVITYEHDHYIDISKKQRDKSRKFLQDHGYVLVVNDISPNDKCSFEDWWVHPDLIDPVILETMTTNNLLKVKNIRNYMYGQ